MRRSGRVAVGLVASALIALGIGEGSHAWAHRRALGRLVRPGPVEAVIVLGYPSRPGGRPHPLQRWRAEIAARTVRPGTTTTLICSGFAGGTGPSEAAVLAGLLHDLGVPESQIVLEERAASTWQNIEFTIPLVADADVVRIASNSLHAWRARRFLWRQRADLGVRLGAADDYRFGERWWLKLPLACYEAVGTWREWRNPRLPPT